MKPSKIIKACHTDTHRKEYDDPTLDPHWILEQVDRLLAWEILTRALTFRMHEELLPQDLCDRIGVHKGFVYEIIKSARKQLNAPN